ncbi:MAG TPA: hypothetical protein P5280_14515 [Cyclobacteriaceae bacterium]|nr:hypothetical protein [Cyclobacteriaceae bacterium]
MSEIIDSLLYAAKEPIAKESINLLGNITFNNVRDLLLYITQKENLTEKIMSISYSHVLGFDKLILAKGNNGEKVRLHIWHKDQPTYQKNKFVDIHDHYWDFSSLVLKGSLLSRKYMVSNTGSNQYQRIKLVPKLLGDYELREAGTQNLELIEQRRIREGEVHTLAHHQLHSIINEGFAVSLVLQGRRLSKENTIYRKSDLIENTQKSNINRMTKEGFKRVIESVLGAFEKSSSNKAI